MTVNKVLTCTGALVFDYALYYRSISVLPITERTLIIAETFVSALGVLNI